MRLGVRTFWASRVVTPARLQFSEAAPVGALVAAVRAADGAGRHGVGLPGPPTVGLLRSD